MKKKIIIVLIVLIVLIVGTLILKGCKKTVVDESSENEVTSAAKIAESE